MTVTGTPQAEVAEVGWVIYEDIFFTQEAHPYKSWITSGILSTDYDYDHTIGSGGDIELKFHDADGNRDWSFAWGGTPLGNEFVDFLLGTTHTNAESTCTSDSLRGHFQAISHCQGSNCSWSLLTNLAKRIDNSDDFSFCKVNNHEHEVKPTC